MISHQNEVYVTCSAQNYDQGVLFGLAPNLRQPVTTRYYANGESSHGIIAQEVHKGVQVGGGSAAGIGCLDGRVLIVFLVKIVCIAELTRKICIGINDRIAALMLAILLATKIAMHFAAGHAAIALKGIGCIAISIGMIEIFLGLLNVMSPDQSEFPQFPADASIIQP